MNRKMIWAVRTGIAYLLVLVMLSGAVLTDGLAMTAKAAGITVRESAGYEEGAYVEWALTDGADGYIVYTSQDKSTWTAIDDELIRSYGTYMRADALGLTAGTWYLKIEAGTFNSVQEKLSTVAEEIVEVTVTAHDRSGYAWVNGTSSGAYNEDGSLKENANVIYVTETTKDTVSLEVTGANANPCVGIQTILDGYKKGGETKPLAVRIIGNVTNASYLLEDDIVIENKKNNAVGITIEGVGEDAVANGWGIRVKNASNVEIRNLGFMNRSSTGEKDNIGLQQDNNHVWVHNCDMFYGNAGSDADQIKGDGALDCKKSDYVTFSYNHFWDSGKCCLLGLSEGSNEYHITYHHNWFDHSDSRHPRVRYFFTHVYNNYYDGNAKYGVGGAEGGASIFVENNYFRNCKYPMLISMQGSDLWDESSQTNVSANGTFSKEDGSIIKAYGNYMEGQTRFIAYSAADDPDTAWDESVDFDAYVASSRDEQVPSTVTAKQGGWTYENFDTAEDFYEYTPDKAEDVPGIVMAHAGRVNGGDFKWTFDNSTDDTSYAVIDELKSACLNYTSSLVSVGGILGASVKVYYTVTFDPGNGDSTWEETVEANQPLEQPETPTTVPEGKVSFGGWYNGDTKWNFSNKVTGNMTLTGKWLAEGESGGESGGDEGGNGGTSIGTDTVIYDITVNGTSSAYFKVSGNINNTAGTSAAYNGTTYSGKPLKIESSTSITFTTTTAAKLVLVFESAFAKSVKVDGTKYTATAGVVEIPVLAAGTHEITKGDTANLYAIYVIPDGSSVTPDPDPATEYTITVDKADGSAATTLTVTAGDEITSAELPTPARDGYVFTGWVDGGNNPVNVPFVPTADMTLTATWKEDSGDPDTQPSVPGEGLKVELAKPGEEYVYTGSAIKPAIVVTNNGEELTEGVDYTVKYSNNIKANTTAKSKAKITVTGKGNLTGSAFTTFDIQPRDLSYVTVGDIVVASGSKPVPVLIYNNVKLTAKDYTLNSVAEDGKLTAVGKYTADGALVVTGKGNYTGSRTLDVKVAAKSELKKFTVTVSKDNLIYNGGEQYPSQVTVTDAKSKDTLTENDYVICWSENVTDAGTKKFTVVGMGAYTGSVTKTYTIKPLAATGKVNASGVKEEGYGYTSAGATLGDDLVVTYSDGGESRILTAGTDYKVTYSNNKKVSTGKSLAKYTVTFLGNYKGTKAVSGTFKVTAASLSGAEVVSADKVYTGKANTYASKPYVTIDGVALKTSDYMVKYYSDASMTDEITSKNKLTLADDADEATVYVKVTGRGNYAGSEATGEYKVRRTSREAGKEIYDLSKARVTVVDANSNKLSKVEYTGEALEPAVEVKYKNDQNSWELLDEKYYKVTYVNNVNKGKATVVITGSGEKYVGSKTAAFRVVARNLKGSGLLDQLFGALGL